MSTDHIPVPQATSRILCGFFPIGARCSCPPSRSVDRWWCKSRRAFSRSSFGP